MKIRIVLFLLFVLSVQSCGDNEPEYNQVYLNISDREYLYVYNQSEHLLCVDKDIPICQKRFASTDNESYHIKYIYRFGVEDEFIINTSIDTQNNKIFITSGKDFILRYKSNYIISTGYNNSYFISSSQHIGFCDISIIESMFKTLNPKMVYNLKIDYNSMTMNPDVCRMAMLIKCLYIYPAQKIDSKNISENEMVGAYNCFYSIYSMDELAKYFK